MKTCPNCNEIVGDSAEICFNCSYNFKYKQILTKEEKKQLERDEENQRIIKQNEANIQILKNPLFEYKVIAVNNLSDGQIDLSQIQMALDIWSEKGWRLHSIFNNELGKTSSAVSIGIIGTSVNATIDQTVMVFERCIKAESK